MVASDLGEADRALVAARQGDDLVAADELLDRGAALFRYALVVFVEELDRPPEDTAFGVDDVLEDLHPVLDLRALHHRARRRLREAHADEDGVLLCQRGQRERRRGCQRDQRADARSDHWGILSKTGVFVDAIYPHAIRLADGGNPGSAVGFAAAGRHT
jgi:hypothetical protein